jgi:hypothetical protein
MNLAATDPRGCYSNLDSYLCYAIILIICCTYAYPPFLAHAQCVNVHRSCKTKLNNANHPIDGNASGDKKVNLDGRGKRKPEI